LGNEFFFEALGNKSFCRCDQDSWRLAGFHRHMQGKECEKGIGNCYKENNPVLAQPQAVSILDLEIQAANR